MIILKLADIEVPNNEIYKINCLTRLNKLLLILFGLWVANVKNRLIMATTGDIIAVIVILAPATAAIP